MAIAIWIRAMSIEEIFVLVPLHVISRRQTADRGLLCDSQPRRETDPCHFEALTRAISIKQRTVQVIDPSSDELIEEMKRACLDQLDIGWIFPLRNPISCSKIWVAD